MVLPTTSGAHEYRVVLNSLSFPNLASGEKLIIITSRHAYTCQLAFQAVWAMCWHNTSDDMAMFCDFNLGTTGHFLQYPKKCCEVDPICWTT